MKDKWLLVVNKTDALLYNYENGNGHEMSSICISKEKDSKNDKNSSVICGIILNILTITEKITAKIFSRTYHFQW